MRRNAVRHLIILVCLLLLSLPVGLAAETGLDTNYQIELKSRQFVPAQGTEQALLQEVMAAGPGRRHVLLQFYEVPNGAQRAALEAAGVWLLAYVPHYAWFASMPAKLTLEDPALAPLRWVGTIMPQDRIAPTLQRTDPGLEAPGRQSETVLHVRFFSDVPADEARSVLNRHGARVQFELAEFRRFEVLADPGAVAALAGEDGVQWIAAGLPPKTTTNDGSRARTNVDAVLSTPYGLSGSGVDLGIWDSGKVSDHVDFGQRLTIVDGGPFVGVSDHATHVAGTMAGDGSNSAAEGGTAYQWKGMAAGADIFSYFWDHSVTDHSGAILIHGIELSQNSWSYDVDTRNCWLYGDYDVDAPEYDDIVVGRYGKRIVVVFAAGNERNDGDCGMSGGPDYLNYANVPPPATAKNVIAVGATNSDDDSMTEFSSWGPVGDGRLKPDVVAPGCDFSSGIRSTLPVNTYGSGCGTSMAAPAVSGISALLIEQYRTSFGVDPLPSTVKALLVQTAVDLDSGASYLHPGPDYASGYGRVDAQAAVDAIIAGQVLEGEIANGQTDTYYVEIPAGVTSLKITLAWDDEPGTVNAVPALVNNLDLELVAPGGGQRSPWVLNPANPNAPATTGTDGLNNVEQVQVNSPEAGTWEVKITGSTVPEGPQLYSLAGEAFTFAPPIQRIYLPVIWTSE